MINPIQNALNFLQTNRVRPNAQNQKYIQVLQSGDSNSGRQLANQFCQQNNIDPQQIINSAPPFLKKMFGL